MAPAAIVTGAVVDSSGQPIPQARVYFTAAPAAVPDIAALTDANGEFVMSAPQAGEYTVTAAGEEGGQASIRVTLSPERDSSVRLVLTET